MWSLAETSLIIASASGAPPKFNAAAHMDVMMLLNFISAFAILVCWAYVKNSRAARLTLAFCLAVQAAIGFSSGAWSLGLLGGFAAVMAAQWWWKERRVGGLEKRISQRAVISNRTSGVAESRLHRLFGPGAN